MANFFILSPVALILGLILHRAYGTGQEKSRALASFRNFFFTWSGASLITGFFTVFFTASLTGELARAFSLPFIYFAGATLIPLPFILYRRFVGLSRALAFVTVFWGIVIGLVLYTNAVDGVGEMHSFIRAFADNLGILHLAAMCLVFVPLGGFFLVESFRASELSTKARTTLIGSGIIIAGVSEGFSVMLASSTGFNVPDYTVPFGFLLILSGVLYARIARTLV